MAKLVFPCITPRAVLFFLFHVSKPIACMLGGGKAPRLSEVHCDQDSVCVKTDTLRSRVEILRSCGVKNM